MENLHKKETKNVVNILKNTTILYDILLVIGSFVICLCLVLFGLGAVGKTKFVDYTYTIGYLVILMIIISTARQIYKEIHYSFKEKCDVENTALDKDFIIESSNRFYSIFSFVYYYIKTFIIVLFHIAFVFLCLFIFFIMLRSNVLYKQTWIKDKINEYWDSEQPIFSLFLVYLVLAFLLGLYLFFMSYVFISEKILGRRVRQISITSISKTSGVVFTYLTIILFPGLLYYLDLYTDVVRIIIQRAKYIVYDNTSQKVIIRYPLLELFKQHNIFAAINLTNIKVLKRFVRIFVFGLLMSCFYAFLILPQFDVERYCHLRFIRKTNLVYFHSWSQETKDEFDQLHIIAQQYQARFKMGYFVVIVLIVFYHMIEISKDAIFRYFWITLKSKPNGQQMTLFSSIDNDAKILENEYKTLLKTYRDYKDQQLSISKNANEIVNDQKQKAKNIFLEKYRDFIQSLETKYKSYIDDLNPRKNLNEGFKALKIKFYFIFIKR
jgi:hypothetical protein